jgi:hypothetical protein
LNIFNLFTYTLALDLIFMLKRSRDSAVGIATPGRPRIRNSSYCKVKNFLHVVQTGSGVNPTSYPMGTGGVKSPGREADHLPPASAKVKKM